MNRYFLFILCAALLLAFNGCATTEQRTSGGSIAPSGSASGSIATHR